MNGSRRKLSFWGYLYGMAQDMRVAPAAGQADDWPARQADGWPAGTERDAG